MCVCDWKGGGAVDVCVLPCAVVMFLSFPPNSLSPPSAVKGGSSTNTGFEMLFCIHALYRQNEVRALHMHVREGFAQ
jgi:hypothetical protein